MFSLSGNVKELKIKLMDKDTLSADDYVGEVKYVASLFICFHAQTNPFLRLTNVANCVLHFLGCSEFLWSLLLKWREFQ